MAELLTTPDAMHAIRTKEIYSPLRDAGRAMRDTPDILHNAVIDPAKKRFGQGRGEFIFLPCG